MRLLQSLQRSQDAGQLCRGIAIGTLILLSATGSIASPIEVDQLVQTALELDRDAQRGGAVYVKHCAGCHGTEALGNRARLVPSLAGQRQAYLIKQLADISQLERDSPEMHAIVSREALAEPQVWANVAAYLNALAPARLPEHGDGRDLELGEAIFQEQCASCHEEDARGDDDGFVPSLRNQHYAYLLQQMEQLASWHRRNIEPGLAMFLGSLDSDERKGIADYLSRLQGPTRDRTTLHDDGTVGD